MHGVTSATTTLQVNPAVLAKILSFNATPATATSGGGTIHLQASVSGLPDCTVTVSPSLVGFPLKPSCLTGTFNVTAVLPANKGATAVTYTFTLSASTNAGKATASTSATVAPEPPPTIASVTASPNSLSAQGGTAVITGSVSGATSCSLSVSPALLGGPWAPNCLGGAISQQITLPKNFSTSAGVTYTFTLTAGNIVGTVTKTAVVTVAPLPLSINSFAASSTNLRGPGGTVTVSGSVIGASTCTIKVSPTLTGAPWSPTCSSGSFSKDFTVPQNTSTTETVVYTFTATFKNPLSTKTATTTVTVAPLDVTKVTSFTASPGPVSLLGGSITLTGTVDYATSCSISVSPTLVGAPFSPSCSAGSLTQVVQLPKNSGKQAVSYTFTLTGKGLAGTSTAKTVTGSVPAVMPAVTHGTTEVIVQPHGSPSALTCPTTSFCVAVDLEGSVMVRTASGWSAPLQVEPNALTGVSCTSEAFCMAVDGVGNAVTYDGTSWSQTTATGAPSLSAVSCASTSTCRAVSSDGSVQSWNGTTWATTTAVSPYSLTAISCPSSSFCMAVDLIGEAFTFSSGTWSAATTVTQDALTTVSCPTTTACFAGGNRSGSNNVLFWNGTTWSGLGAPGDQNAIVAISCPSTSTCVAVDDSGSSYLWASSQWSTGTSLTSTSMLTGLSCNSPSSCTVVGLDGNAWIWDASSWTAVGVIDRATGTFTAVSCWSPAHCMALSSNGDSFVRAQGTWSQPLATGLSDPAGVSCTSSTFCLAVSLDGTAATYNGTSWTATAALSAPLPLDAVSCTSSTFCLAVSAGGDFVSFNGSSWATPINTASVNSYAILALNSVSCVSSSFCAAVSQSGLVWFWNGTTIWSKVFFELSVPGQSISCASTTYCVVGSRDGRVATWTGTSTLALVTVSDQAIAGVSCIKGSNGCFAVDTAGRLTSSVGGTTWSTLEGVTGTGVARLVSNTTAGEFIILDDTTATVSSVS